MTERVKGKTDHPSKASLRAEEDNKHAEHDRHYKRAKPSASSIASTAPPDARDRGAADKVIVTSEQGRKITMTTSSDSTYVPPGPPPGWPPGYVPPQNFVPPPFPMMPPAFGHPPYPWQNAPAPPMHVFPKQPLAITAHRLATQHHHQAHRSSLQPVRAQGRGGGSSGGHASHHKGSHQSRPRSNAAQTPARVAPRPANTPPKACDIQSGRKTLTPSARPTVRTATTPQAAGNGSGAPPSGRAPTQA